MVFVYVSGEYVKGGEGGARERELRRERVEFKWFME